MAASPERQNQHDHTPGKVLCNALLLLGHNSGSYGAPISEALFDKPNSKAFEAILHFLLSKVRGAAQGKKDFKGIWPIKDARQQKDFKKAVHAMLMELEHDDKLPRRLVAAVPSMFAMAAGQRVVELLCFLACYALGQQLQQHFPHELQHVPMQACQVQGTQANADLLDPATYVAQAQSTVQRKRFLKNAATYASLQAQWQPSAEQLSARFNSLQQEQDATKNALANMEAPALSAPEQQAQLEQAKTLWKDLQDHLTSLQGLQKLVDSVVDSSCHPHAVDGQRLQCMQAAAVGNTVKADAPSATAATVPEGIDIVQLLQGLTEAVASYHQPLSTLAGGSGSRGMSSLALPGDQGGHEPHLAAALAAQQQHCHQQQHLHAALQTDLAALGAYKQALIQQVAAAMKAKDAHGHSDQENQSPDATSHDSCQGAVLQLVPPTPHGTAPMRAAAMSVAAKGSQAGVWAAPLPVEGRTVMKQKVQQAAMMQEHSWTPLGTQMPASAALPPSSAKPLTARSAMPASTVKRMRYPLACIDEEDAAAPRRLSYSSPSEHQDAIRNTVVKHEEDTPRDSRKAFVSTSAQVEAPLSVAALMARMHKLRHMG